jgi:anti-anti-sigma regulatory factor
MIAARELTDTDLHYIFAVECRGDTLIVTPRGDAAGFPPHQFRAAVQRLQTRCGGRPTRNLIIDLGGSSYPGLSMLGAFRDLIGTVRGRGGTAAVAGMSPETTRVLAEYGIDREWTTYPDLPAATRSVVHESLPERLRRIRRPLLWVAAVLSLLLLAGAAAVAVDRRPVADTYRQTESLWKEYRRLQRAPLDEVDWRREVQALAKRADRLQEKLHREPGVVEVSAAVDGLRDVLHSPQRPETRGTEFEAKLAKARQTVRDTDWRHRVVRNL